MRSSPAILREARPDFNSSRRGCSRVPLAFVDSESRQGLTNRQHHFRSSGEGDIGFDEKLGFGQLPIRVGYDSPSGETLYVDSDYLILAIPYTAQRAITKSRPFAPKQKMAIRNVRYVEVTKVLLQYKSRW